MDRVILLVDSEAAARGVLATQLASRGFKVHQASNVEEAVASFEAAPAGLLVSDVILPDGTGYDLISRLRNLEGAADLPLILMSDLPKSPGERAHAKSVYNALAMLVKPFPLNTLIDVLRQVFDINERDALPSLSSLDESVRGKIIEGEIHPTTFSKLFCHFYRSGATGVLRMDRGPEHREIYFVKGQPVFAGSNVEKEGVGQHMMQMGQLKLVDYQRALEIQRYGGGKFGENLVDLGIMSEETLYKTLRFHLREKILAAFGWREGRYEFKFTDEFVKKVEQFNFNAYDLILTGVRRFYPVETLRGELLKLWEMPLQVTDYGRRAQHHWKLRAPEQRIFDRFDGTTPLKEIIESEEGKTQAAALAIVYTFLLLGVVEVRLSRAGDPGAQASA
ncbi:MAG: response regulator [Chrysiogenetes bacterium]|nr:response regulator [Chrysiogenetes bacterium]